VNGGNTIRLPFRSTSARAAERGFTLVEILIAIALLTVGVLGVGVVLVAQSGISGGADFGTAVIARGNSYSTAAMLAQSRIEEMKRAGYAQVTVANFGNEAYGAIATYPAYRRTVGIQDNLPDPGTKTITVDVFFRPQRVGGPSQEESVRLVTILGQHP
jgi:prepilin-type N-terminal cleavage/methylation domain-containing protein